MNLKSLRAMTIRELTRLHEEVEVALARKIELEKRELEKQLAQLGKETRSKAHAIVAEAKPASQRRVRRAYPPVRPKYRNPADPTETWAGRGKQPRWLVSQLKSGKKIEDFLINTQAAKAARRSSP